MVAKIICIANTKGGSGKTTTAANLGGALSARHYSGLLVDADTQNSMCQYAAQAPDDEPYPVPVISLAAAGNKLHREIRAHVDNYDFILIDCPPHADAPQPLAAMLVADLVIIPSQPSPLDLWASVTTEELIENQAMVSNEGLKARYLFTRDTPKTAIAGAAREQSGQIFRFPVLTSFIGNRESYKLAAARGSWVGAMGSKHAAARLEVERLADEILALVGLPEIKTAVAAE